MSNSGFKRKSNNPINKSPLSFLYGEILSFTTTTRLNDSQRDSIDEARILNSSSNSDLFFTLCYTWVVEKSYYLLLWFTAFFGNTKLPIIFLSAKYILRHKNHSQTYPY